MDEIRVLVENLNIRVKGETLKLTISIGGFIQTNLATSLQDAIQKADSALYKSKHSGRNRVTYFDISKKKVLYREKLKDLIENDNLICFYQPIKDLKNLSTHHYEALFRLKDGGTIIYPMRYFQSLRIATSIVELV